MPPALRTPIGIGNSAWRDPLWSAGIGQTATDQINAALQQAGLPPNEVQAAVQAYSGLDANSTAAVLGILDGGPINLETLAPLIGAGLAATGVGLPVVAAVTALLPVLDGIIGMFAGSDQPQVCTWTVGPTPGSAVCFNRIQPFGPTDPSWETFDQFAGGTIDQDAVTNYRNMTFGATVSNSRGQQIRVGDLGNAFPGFMTGIGCWLAAHPNAPAGVDGFRFAYYKAWMANAEFAINGYQSADPYALLTACANAWNRGHSAHSTATFTPVTSGGAPCDDYIGLLLAGAVDQRDHPPVTINTGPRIILLNAGALRKQIAAQNAAKASSSSAATKAAIGSAVVAGGAALGVGIWALATHQAYGAAWGKVWSGVKKPFKKR